MPTALGKEMNDEPVLDIPVPALRVEVNEDAAEPVRFAAAELRRYLTKILGGKPHLHPEQRSPMTIVVEEMVNATARSEGFEIRRDPSGLRIIGRDPAGALFGSYFFLRQFCGCRFSSLAPDGEYVPKKNTLSIGPLPCTRSPRLGYRGLQFYYYEGRDLMVSRLDWMAKNGLNYVMFSPAPEGDPCVDVDPATGAELHVKTGTEQRYSKAWFDFHLLPEIRKRGLKLDLNHHNLAFWMPPARDFTIHPDWYALIDGERKPRATQLCLCTSNPDAIATLTERVRQFLRDHREVNIAGIIPEDWFGMCQCDECRQLDDDPGDAFRPKPIRFPSPKLENRSKSRRYARLIQTIALAIRDEFPDVRIGMSAYMDLLFPTEDVDLPANTICWVALYWRQSHVPLSSDSPSAVNRFLAEVLQRWRQQTRGDLIVYEYYMGMEMQRSLPYPIWEVICRDWQELPRLGVQGATIQIFGTNHAAYALNCLAFARCGWEESVDPDRLLHEFLEGEYGAAGSGGGLEPNGKKIVYFLRKIDRSFAHQCLERAIAQAKTAREKRQVAALAQAFAYWELSADFAETCDRAERWAQQSPHEAIHSYQQAIALAETRLLPESRGLPTGWFAVRADWCWNRRIAEAQQRLQTLADSSGPVKPSEA
jgi:hypothetical protein